MKESTCGPIGVFDSGYGGLTILREIRRRLPGYDYMYLGDNARAPYGTRSFDVVYEFTLQAVEHLFAMGCPLVILACNTASAKALRTIQQRVLPTSADPSRRVLGVIRPTVEAIASTSTRGHVGIFATPGTVASRSYEMEIDKLYPGMRVTQHACPMWVPIVENGYADSPGADWFVRNDVEALFSQASDVDTILLACTHYPLLRDRIEAAVAGRAQVISQGAIVAESLADYLMRHPEMERRLTRGGSLQLLTTENPDKFSQSARVFLGDNNLTARHTNISASSSVIDT